MIFSFPSRSLVIIPLAYFTSSRSALLKGGAIGGIDRRSKGIRLGTGKERESAALAGDILLDLGNPL
jgi:hypothetical protein